VDTQDGLEWQGDPEVVAECTHPQLPCLAATDQPVTLFILMPNISSLKTKQNVMKSCTFGNFLPIVKVLKSLEQKALQITESTLHELCQGNLSKKEALKFSLHK
jgi:hypothetical protein